MKYFIKNKVISMGGDSTVTDEKGNVVFKIDGKVFSPRKRKNILDKDGRLLYIVRNKFFNFINHTAYVLNTEKEQVATVYRRGFRFENRFMVEGHQDKFQIEGKVFRRTYSIIRNDEVVATITRPFKVVSFRDEFELETDDVESLPLYVSMVIAIDNIVDNIEDEHD